MFKHLNLFETWSHVAQDDLEPLNFLSPSPECWDYGSVPPCLVSMQCDGAQIQDSVPAAL